MSQDRVYLELLLSKAIATDENGNWIVEAEASNENLDFDGQVVLQRALLDSKDYFLQNGVISYDHRHLRADPDDPNWSPEKYIIGEPIEVYNKGSKTFVKAKLYKSNQIARELVAKLKDGSTRIKTSVGGKRPEVVSTWNNHIGRMVEQVARVLWDELAITFKPVNQSLTPVALSSSAFVKSLQAGFGTDSADMSGGRAMIGEDLEKKNKPHVMAVVMGFAHGDIEDEDEAEQFLKNRGCSADEAKTILRSIITDRDTIREEVLDMADSNLLKAFDESMQTLEKAIKGTVETGADSVAEKGYADEPPAAAIAAVPPEVEEKEEDEKGEEGKEEEMDAIVPPPTKPKKSLEKSLYDEMKESDGELLEVTPFLDNLTKSLSRRLGSIEKSINGVEQMQKSIGNGLHSTGMLLKSLADVPAPRQAVINRQERTFLGNDGKEVKMGRVEILAKARDAVSAGKMSLNEAGALEERLNKGMPIGDADLRLLKSM
ncbi:MAG: hypothetical protein SAMD01599839_07930 [Rectinema sp.]